MIAIMPNNTHKYKVGQLIYHIRFDYRGVIYKIDDNFQLSDEWYEHMCKKTKSPKDKPWYSVLKHNSSHTTYVTEGNLILDMSEEDIIHPMVPIYFTTLEDGVYSKSSNWIDGKPVVPNNIGLA